MIQNYSIKELAEKMEVSSNYICDVESSRKYPSINMLEKYAIALDVKVSTLLYFCENNDDNHQRLLYSILDKMLNNKED